MVQTSQEAPEAKREVWELADTGGNCTAWRAEVKGGYWLATRPDDPSAPDEGEPAWLSFYPEEDDAYMRYGYAVAAFDLSRVQPLTVDGVEFEPCPSQGCFYGVDHRHDLLSIGMDSEGVALPDVLEVTNFDGRQDLLDEVNTLLGTDFSMRKFPGR